jgi:hypothetical protein
MGNTVSQSDIDKILDEVNDQEPLGTGYTPRLGVGTHTVLLSRYGIGENLDKSKKFEADFVVLESKMHPEGQLRGWAWFVQQPKWGGQYERDNNREFLETAGQSIGDTREPKYIGADFLSDAQKGRGTKFRVTVVERQTKDGKPYTTKKGEIMTNAKWQVVPQTLEDIAEARATLDDIQGVTTDPEPVAAPEPTPAPAPAATSKLGGLKKKA